MHPILTRGYLVPLIAVIAMSSGCAQLQQGAYKSAEAAETYCKNNPDLGRQAVRATLEPALVEKDIALGLRCPGETSMHIMGDPKTIVTD